MPRRPASPCTWPGCPTTVDGGGRCDGHQPQRPGPRDRGYDTRWEHTRVAYLRAFPICCLCGQPSTVADHHPKSRRQLITEGVPDPDAWQRLRPLCLPCHSSETARLQPGGWNQR